MTAQRIERLRKKLVEHKLDALFVISPETARDAYGVVIDTQTWRVDTAATHKLRADLRLTRAWSEVPKVLWQDASTGPESAV